MDVGNPGISGNAPDNYPNPGTGGSTVEDTVGETIDRGGGRTSVEGTESDLRSDTRTEHDPDRLSHDAAEPLEPGGDASLSETISCNSVTGLDCDFVARPDDSADWAPRGEVREQLLTQITTHIGKAHPDRVLSQKEIEQLRGSISS